MRDPTGLSQLIQWIILPLYAAAAPSHLRISSSQQDPQRLQHRQAPYLATNPVPQYLPQALSVASSKAVECKNCPWGGCLNALAVSPGTELGFACWTQGESVNSDRTWVRHHYGTRTGDFCYVSPWNMLQQSSEFYRSSLPYCGAKSELNFFLPRATTKTELFTECSLCPFRDCEGVEFYQAGVSLDVNCVVTDGWMQVSPSHETGTKKYYRTLDNCYVSAATVKELPLQADSGEPLPACGPIPHLKLQDRPAMPDSPNNASLAATATAATTASSSTSISSSSSSSGADETQQQQTQQAPPPPPPPPSSELAPPKTTPFALPQVSPASSVASPSTRPGPPQLAPEEADGEESDGDSDDEDDGSWW